MIPNLAELSPALDQAGCHLSLVGSAQFAVLDASDQVLAQAGCGRLDWIIARSELALVEQLAEVQGFAWALHPQHLRVAFQRLDSGAAPLWKWCDEALASLHWMQFGEALRWLSAIADETIAAREVCASEVVAGAGAEELGDVSLIAPRPCHTNKSKLLYWMWKKMVVRLFECVWSFTCGGRGPPVQFVAERQGR